MDTLTSLDGPVTIYTANSTAIAKSLVNAPAINFTVGVTVLVFSPYGSTGNYLTQIIIHKSELYIRHRLGGDYYDWKTITTETVP